MMTVMMLMQMILVYVLDFGLNAAYSCGTFVAVGSAPFAVAVAHAVHQSTVRALEVDLFLYCISIPSEYRFS